ncbi:MAG: 2-methylcitrate dehydratase [Chloroflexota bacterium]
MPKATYLCELGELVAQTRPEQLPQGVIEQAKLVLLDTLGAIVGGSQLPEIGTLARFYAAGGGFERATILGQEFKVPLKEAAFINGCAGVALELDEGHRLAGGHPAVHVLPAALALAETRQLSGRELLVALVVGYEVAARIGMATSLRPMVHPHGTWGCLGAAAAAARLIGWPAERVAEALSVTGSLTLATSWCTALEGATVRNAYAGLANLSGLLAIELVAAGFTGPADGPGLTFNQATGEGFRAGEILIGLGSDWQITHNYFKFHACCAYNHPVLDALLELRTARPFEPEEVEAIEVETWAKAAILANPEPESYLGAKFSIPFACATLIVYGSTRPEAFGPDTVRDPQVLALARKVRVREDPELTKMVPAMRPARVKVWLRGGEVLTKFVPNPRGDRAGGKPAERDELEAKFLGLVEPVLGRLAALEALGLIWRIEELPDVGSLAATLSRGFKDAAAGGENRGFRGL